MVDTNDVYLNKYPQNPYAYIDGDEAVAPGLPEPMVNRGHHNIF